MNMICEPLVRFVVRSDLKCTACLLCYVHFLAVVSKDELHREACLEAAVQTHLLCSLGGSASETQVDPRQHRQRLSLIHTLEKQKSVSS